MGISQASTTQCDFVTAFWLTCAVSAGLDVLASPTSLRTLALGSSLSLAGLTKATAFVIAAPLVCWFLVRLLAGPRRRPAFHAKHLTLVLLPLVLLNGAFYARNYRLFGSPLGVTRDPGEVVTSRGVAHFAYGNDVHTPRVLASNVLRNLGLHLSTPFPDLTAGIDRGIRSLHGSLGIDANDVRTTWPGTEFRVSGLNRDEDRAGNFLHLVLIVACVLAGAITWRSPQTRRLAGYGGA
ncbi:MAG TPA: hypothetical protein VFW33_00030 [Gemmataceae bacterium]|nr:hypothetical protein [Gemmataceae bacterium]